MEHKIKLPGYEAQLSQSGMQHSQQKLTNQSKKLLPLLPNTFQIKVQPITNENQSINYRCKCSFQFVFQEEEDEDGGATMRIEYAMRSNQTVIPLGTAYFPIALPSIQTTMKLLHSKLNSKTTPTSRITEYKYPNMRYDITSCTFLSSWDQKEQVIIVNYSSCIRSRETQWKIEALDIFTGIQREVDAICTLVAIIGRSKHVELVIDGTTTDDSLVLQYGTISKKEVRIHDCMTLPKITTSGAPTQSIHYIKSIDAFIHPNGNVMNQALQWLLQISHSITSTTKPTKSTLVEFYCGSGAHTIPIAKLGHYTTIIAIDIDHRLLHSFRDNVTLNHLDAAESDCCITILQRDVQKMANDLLKYRRQPPWIPNNTKQSIPTTATDKDDDTVVLLVDPPRCGLGLTTCQYIIQEISIQYVLYISCNINSLKIDLSLLLQNNLNRFTILDCTLLDLFPRTDSIETLICLKRN